MLYVTRSQWGARPPRSSTKLNATGGVALHWEGSHLGIFAHETCDDKIRSIQNSHMDKSRWADIAYNFLVCPHGYVFEGRGYGIRSAAQGTKDANDRFYGVCYLSGPEDAFTDKAKSGFLEIIASLRATGGAGSEIHPHSFFRNTDCPGPDIEEWITAGLPSPGFSVPSSYFTEEAFVPAPFIRSQGGYVVLGGDGGIFTYDGAPFYGSLPGLGLAVAAISLSWTPSGNGYWILGSDGGVFAFGDAVYHGGFNALPADVRGDRTPIGIVASGNGYKIIAIDPSNDGSPFDYYSFP